MSARGAGTALVLGVFSAAGCGDLGDAELPFAPRRPGPTAMPGSQAIARLAIAAGETDTCALEQTIALPPSATFERARTGAGDRLVDGDRDGTGVRCGVHALDEHGERFRVEALISAEALPRLRLTGELSSRRPSEVRVELELTDGSRADTSCVVEETQLLPGAALLELTGCSAWPPGTGHGGCRLDLVALLENCAR